MIGSINLVPNLDEEPLSKVPDFKNGCTEHLNSRLRAVESFHLRLWQKTSPLIVRTP
jgi:hypothetical protein